MNMKTAHDLARELLAGPDIPIFHFDPSCAGFDQEADTSISEPTVQLIEAEEYENEDGVKVMSTPFLTIVGRQREEHGLGEDQ